MHLVEFPKKRNAVAEEVIDPIAELVGQKQRDRHDRGRDEWGELGRRHYSEHQDQSGIRRLAHDVIGQDGPTEQDPHQERVEEEEAHVGPSRAAAQQAFWKYGPE